MSMYRGDPVGSGAAAIPTPTHPNEVAILDGVLGGIGSDVVDLGLLLFFDLYPSFHY